MNYLSNFKTWMSLAGFVACAMSVAAQTEAPPAAPNAPMVNNTIQLPYGVADVVKLTHAGIGEETVVAFVQSKNSQYGLGTTDILYLKDQGVSDRVIAAMLQNGKNTAQPMPPATTYNPPSATYSTPAQTYSAPADSSVYVVPQEPAYVYSDNYYPSYSWAPYYYYPPVVFGFGFGGRFHDRGFSHVGFHSFGGARFGGGFHSGSVHGSFHSGGSFGHHR